MHMTLATPTPRAYCGAGSLDYTEDIDAVDCEECWKLFNNFRPRRALVTR